MVYQNIYSLALQILYCVQFPMVIGLTVTRFSISLLFLRLFFTKIYPKLRMAGIFDPTASRTVLFESPN